MSVQASCFHCQHPNSFADKWAGRVMRCQKCGGILTLPRLDAPSAPKADLSEIAQSHLPVTAPRAVPAAAFKAAPPLAREQSFPAALPEPINQAAGKPVSAGLAATLCAANAIIVLLIGAAAALIALPSTRAAILQKIQSPAIPSTGPQVAWVAAALALLFGGFYLVCAVKMLRNSRFARAAATAAMLQTALQIALFLSMTFHGQLNYVSLAAVTVSLIALCGLIDLALRSVRMVPSIAAQEQRHVSPRNVSAGSSEPGLQARLT